MTPKGCAVRGTIPSEVTVPVRFTVTRSGRLRGPQGHGGRQSHCHSQDPFNDTDSTSPPEQGPDPGGRSVTDGTTETGSGGDHSTLRDRVDLRLRDLPQPVGVGERLERGDKPGHKDTLLVLFPFFRVLQVTDRTPGVEGKEVGLRPRLHQGFEFRLRPTT